MSADCYDYVRRYYNVPAYVGMRVRVGGKKLGVIVESDGAQRQYIKIQLIGEPRPYLYHPEYGIEYIVEGTEPVSRKW